MTLSTRHHDVTLRRTIVAAAVAALSLACSKSEKAASDSAAVPGAAGTPVPGAGASTAASATGLPTPLPGAPPAGATAQMVALGDSIFHGLAAGGTCQTCHGPDANGTPLAPSLTDTQWLTGDGSYAFIQKRVTEGMPTPTPPYTAAMPPMGGAQLTPDQIKAVAAYAYSLSHKS